jgi:hypothetical protein
MDNAQRGLPGAFFSPRALRRKNLVAVAATLAAFTGVVATLFDSSHADDYAAALGHTPFTSATICSASTLVYGLLWAASLRSRFGNFPMGWFVAIPLAALNAGTSLGLILIGNEYERGLATFFGGLMLGATFGAMVWLPALALTLLVFGIPLALVQRAAGQGLGKEERGERVVAVVAMGVAFLALLGVPSLAHGRFEAWWLFGLALVGLGAGASAAIDATRREKSRRAFVESVERGDAPGYRIDTSPHQAPQLVRVVGSGEGHYRTPTLAEPLAELDESGEVRRLYQPR